LGAGATYTELVSAKGIVYKSENTKKLLYVSDKEKAVHAQLFGSEPLFVYEACISEDLAPFKVIDINMGCPVPKIFKNGEGSALLTDILKAEKVIKGAVKSGKTITVKIRIGISDKTPYITKEYAKMAESAGASLITIHGRTRENYYSGEVNFKEIESAKNSVNIPVIANGGIFTEDDANLMMAKTGADGVMLARGAVANPFLFSLLTGTKTDLTVLSIIDRQINDMLKTYSDRYVTLNMRKFFPNYFKGRRNSKELCRILMTAENTDNLKKLLFDNYSILD